MKMSFVVGVAVLLVANIQYGMASSSSTSGAVYTRWGRSKCREGATLVYSGFAGGSHYLHRGGAVEPICLPENPQWGHDHTTHAERGFVYGAEYETRSFGKLSKVQDHDVPCAVCEADGKKSVIVIPARKDCIEGWGKEYSGYLMTGRHEHVAASTYTCVDDHPKRLPGGRGNKDGYLFYPVEAQCGSLKCPPFKHNGVFLCVVCSKA